MTTTIFQTTVWQASPLTPPPFTTNTIHLWRANLDEQNYPLTLLSSDEKIRAARFKFPIHQQRFTNARSILRCILARYLNQSPETLCFQYTAHGKPFLSNQPSISFNLSHSNQWALYAISLEEKIGVDVEHIRADTETTAITQRFFSAYENKMFDRLSTAQKKAAFFRLWTCKEAFIKAVGEGLSFPLTDFDVDITENIPRLLMIRGDEKAAQAWSLLQIALTENYVSALVVKGKIDCLKKWDFCRGDSE